MYDHAGLASLQLSGNWLLGCVPAALMHLGERLTCLDVCGTGISELPHWFSALTCLKDLQLGSNNLHQVCTCHVKRLLSCSVVSGTIKGSRSYKRVCLLCMHLRALCCMV